MPSVAMHIILGQALGVFPHSHYIFVLCIQTNEQNMCFQNHQSCITCIIQHILSCL
jgi:ribosomal protein S27E